MDSDLMNMPGYRYWEYLLVLNPHEELRNKIMHIKSEFGESYGENPVTYAKPHITLAKFTAWQMLEDRILNKLKVVAMGMPAFKVVLKDYGMQPSHTIFIDVTTKVPIQQLVKEIRTGRRLMKSPDHDPFFITEPTVTIARKLTPVQYEKASVEYAHRQFTGSFIADGMLLLKRSEGQRAYQIVQRLEFQNLPVNTKQGELFS